MTTPTPFSAKLRALSKDASPGPWTLGPCSHGGLILRRPPGDDAPIRDRHPQGHLQIVPEADAHIVVALRNHADRLADLVERVAQYRAALESVNALPPGAALVDWSKARLDYVTTNDAMLAALDALDGGWA